MIENTLVTLNNTIESKHLLNFISFISNVNIIAIEQ
jgi:hypothetical protein